MLIDRLSRAREFVGFVRDPLAAFVETSRRRGDVAILPIPGPRLIQLTHPAHINTMFAMSHRDKAGTESLKDLLGTGLITNDGEGHVARRQLVGRPLSRKAIASFVEDMQALTRDFCASFDAAPDRPVEVTSRLFSLSLDILVRTVFGAQIRLDKQQFASELDIYMYEFYLDNTRWRRVLPPRIMTPGRRRRQLAVATMQEIVRRCIDTRRRGAPGNDLLFTLLGARDEAGQPLGDADLLDELLTMIIPGHETPALLLGYALWVLGEHPEVQEQLHAEVASLDRLTTDSIAECPYLRAVVDETFRLYPPAYVLGREVRKHGEIGGLPIRPGDQLIAPQWVVHRDARWWRSPERFRPERWTNGETKQLEPGTFFPFGGGQRSCLGGHFSRLMGQVVIAEIVKNLEVARDESYSLSFIQGVTLRTKEGIRVRVRRRPAARTRTATTSTEARIVH